MSHNSAAQDEDMSMDEILASIRRYVTGDGDAASNSPASQQEISRQPRVVQLTSEDEWRPKSEEAPAPQSGGIISDQARASAQRSFQKMEQLKEAKSQTQASGSKTVDDFIVELLRPMLRQWMDKNLPGLVERMVEREIQNTLHSDRV